MGCGCGDEVEREGGVSRRQLIGATGATGAAAVLSGVPFVGNALAGRPQLTNKQAARRIREIHSGRISGNHNLEVARLVRHLAESDNGTAVVRRLRKMDKPRRVLDADDDSDGNLGSSWSPPTDRVSVHEWWWGWSIYIPHSQIVAIEQGLKDNYQGVVDTFDTACQNSQTGESGGEVCGFIAVAVAYLALNIGVLLLIDRRNHNGASLNAPWIDPIAFYPGPF
jgi:hypothetical protein